MAAIKNPFETGSPTVDKMSRLQISGNIIPVTWYKTIKKETGKPNLNAIIILADIVYWYRPVEVRDEMTGQLIGLKKKFHADLLQRSYQQIAEQFGITKRDATNAVVELEKLGAIQRVFRTLQISGQQVPNVLFLDLHVDMLESLTYPKPENQGRRLEEKSYPPKRGGISPKMERGVTDISETVSRQSAGGITAIRETNTKISKDDYHTENSYASYQRMETQIKEQISFGALKNDHPYDERIDEVLGILLDIMSATADTIRVNQENKPSGIVKSQMLKLTKQHVEYVLHCMDENHTKARNIRAVLVTALYNSVYTISSYYGNLFQFHLMNDVEDKEVGGEDKI